MKIVIQHDGSSAHFFDRTGWLKVFQFSGHQVIFWDSRSKPALDLFSEIGEVDLLIGQTYNVDDALLKVLYSRPSLRFIAKAGEWGNHTKDWDQKTKEEFPILIESNKTKRIIKQLKEDTGKPDFVFCHYHQDYLEMTHGDWESIGIPVLSLMNAADLWDYTNGQYNQQLDSQVCYIGGYWPYKARTLNPYILPLCNPNLKLKIQVWGNGWNVPQAMGQAPNELVKHLFKSAAVNPAISEPHSQKWGYDVTEKIFKLTSNKSFVISDYVEGMEKIYGDSVEYARTGPELLEKTLYYIANPAKKMKLIQRSYDITLVGHTYFERCESIFNFYGLDFEVKKIKAAKDRLIKELRL